MIIFAVILFVILSAVFVPRAAKPLPCNRQHTSLAFGYLAVRWLLSVAAISFSVAVIENRVSSMRADEPLRWLLYVVALFLLCWAHYEPERPNHTGLSIGAMLLRLAYAAATLVLFMNILVP